MKLVNGAMVNIMLIKPTSQRTQSSWQATKAT